MLLAALWSGFAAAGPDHWNNQRHHSPRRDHQGHHSPHVQNNHHDHHRNHHGHRSRIVFFTAPVSLPRYVYPAPVYYFSPPPSPVYVEPVRPQTYWYYCPDYQAYYPHVQHCPGAWLRVLPQPPG